MEKETEIKTVSADTHLQIWVTCPYCREYQNRLDELREHLGYGELRAENCDAEIRCEECQKIFIVKEISY